LTKIEELEERLDKLPRGGSDPNEPSEEGNLIRWFWVQLHWTPEEAAEYDANHERMAAIVSERGHGPNGEPGGPYLSAEDNREYMRLSARCTQLAHDIQGKRVIANDAMRDRVWPDLAPRVLRYSTLQGKTAGELAENDKEELGDLEAWFEKLRREAIETAEKELAKTSQASEQ
jgi:hypothetical protein